MQRPGLRKRYPDVRPLLLSERGPWIMVRAFKAIHWPCGLSNVRTSSDHPRSLCKIEREHHSLKTKCSRP